MLLEEMALKMGKVMSTVDIGMRYLIFFYVDKRYIFLDLHRLI